MKPAIFFLIFVLLSLNTAAFDCSIFDGIDRDNCIELNEQDENYIANIIYKNYSIANHEFISEYNDAIIVDAPPDGYVVHNSSFIKDAWLSILTIQPSVVYHNNVYVPEEVELRSEYDYHIAIPQNYLNSNGRRGDTCRIDYSLYNENALLNVTSNNLEYGNQKMTTISIDGDSTLTTTLTIYATIQRVIYTEQLECCIWRRPRCRQYCLQCRYQQTDYQNDQVQLSDHINVKYYSHNIQPGFTFIEEYANTKKGIIEKDNQTNIAINFDNAVYSDNALEFSANFSKKPYNFLTITAVDQNSKTTRNLISNNDTIFVNSPESCRVKYNDFFIEEEIDCINAVSETEIAEFQTREFSNNWNLLFGISIFVFINVIIFKVIRKSWGKKFIVPILLVIFVSPFVSADECGLSNLASCIPQKIFEFMLDIFNAPLEPLLSMIRTFMENPPSIELFIGIWAIVVYCISIFYGFLFMYAGFQFLFSGHNVIKREMAKEWLKNTVIMIVLIQASFYLYGLILELSSVMTSAVLSLVNEQFFLLTADNFINIGLEFLLVIFYVIILLVTVLCLILRYIMVALGVILAPIGIFCYFIPPIKGYGKLIINILGVNIFITFIASIIILACSMLINIEIFENIKIMVMIICFLIIDLMFIIATIHAIIKSATTGGSDKITEAVKYISMLF